MGGAGINFFDAVEDKRDGEYQSEGKITSQC